MGRRGFGFGRIAHRSSVLSLIPAPPSLTMDSTYYTVDQTIKTYNGSKQTIFEWATELNAQLEALQALV